MHQVASIHIDPENGSVHRPPPQINILMQRILENSMLFDIPAASKFCDSSPVSSLSPPPELAELYRILPPALVDLSRKLYSPSPTTGVIGHGLSTRSAFGISQRPALSPANTTPRANSPQFVDGPPEIIVQQVDDINTEFHFANGPVNVTSETFMHQTASATSPIAAADYNFLSLPNDIILQSNPGSKIKQNSSAFNPSISSSSFRSVNLNVSDVIPSKKEVTSFACRLHFF